LPAELTPDEYNREMARLAREACSIRERLLHAEVEIYSAQHPLAQSYIPETGCLAPVALRKSASDERPPHSPRGDGLPDADNLLEASLFSFTSPDSS
jgi:hypothetical protein